MARVIKAGARVVPRGLAEAKAEAERLVADARREGARLVERAQADARRVEAEAQERGRAEAAKELVEAARARDALLAEAEPDVVEIALTAATKIVEAHVAVGPAEVAALVRATLERARRAKKASVLLHPDDVATLGGADLPPNVEIVADPSLARGDCVVRSELGTVDARVATKLDAVRAALLGKPR